ncbi:short transient receptor potential channel 5-like [Ptychodera flava]|uniref:short transient receptor potential channel 5-like n=1 Tax=Ptychodera flava TaxID=63121 RepID=UPI00396A9708
MANDADDAAVLTSDKERSYLEAVEKGDAAAVKSFLRDADFNKNVEDSNGWNAADIAIINRQLDILRSLLQHQVNIGNALLRAVDTGFVKAVAVICEHAQTLKDRGHDVINGSTDSKEFPPGVTPIILGAHRNNYDVCKILLNNGANLESAEQEDKLGKTHGLSRSLKQLQMYRALTSESYICLTSKDPISRAFQLSHKLQKMAKKEVHFGQEYEKLREDCEQFAADLLTHTRNEHEITTVLTHGPQVWRNAEAIDTIKPHKALEAVKYEQKKFVTHPNCQQLLYNRWYYGLKDWEDYSSTHKVLFVLAVMFGYPFLSLAYIVWPFKRLNELIHTPFVKFLMHVASSLAFLFLIILVLLRVETWDQVGFAAFIPTSKGNTSKAKEFLTLLDESHGRNPTQVEIVMLIFIVGITWREVKEIWSGGLHEYCQDSWNVLDIIQISLYWISYIFFFYAMGKRAAAPPEKEPDVSEWFNTTASNLVLNELTSYVETNSKNLSANLTPENVRAFSNGLYFVILDLFNIAKPEIITRMQWPGDDPNIIAEAFFALANIISFLRLLHIMVINRHIGPLQISLWGMFYDIAKFLVIFFLMLLAFAIGLTQLYKFYASDWSFNCITELVAGEEHKKWECTNAFDGVLMTIRTLFWSLFGLIDLEVLGVEADHGVTVNTGEFAFALYHGLAIIVLLNALIAMMSNTYTRVEENADREWKFYRTQMWMGYFEEGATVAPPFNIIPSFKTIKKIICCKTQCRQQKRKRDNSSKIAELQTEYETVVSRLMSRYISDKRSDGYEDEEDATKAVTQHDILVLKQELSSFRYDYSDSMAQLNKAVSRILKRLDSLADLDHQEEDGDSGPAPSTDSASSYGTAVEVAR